MSAAPTLFHKASVEHMAPGAVLLRRSTQPDSVIFVESGRVVLGILDAEGALQHQLGTVQGPAWLDATAVILDLPCVVDGVAETEVELRRLPRADLLAARQGGNAADSALLLDIARAHRQQTELAVSRVAKDAEARCAEWLLRHAEPMTGSASWAVRLQQRKRLIAAQLGIAPETLSRVLRHLRERSLISGSGSVVQLVDLGGLQALAGS
jgi:CRP-like cAMP-binding protein